MQIRRLMSASGLVFLLAACSSEMTPPELPPEVDVIRDVTLTDDARIPQNDPAYTGVEIYDTRLVFLYSATPTITLEPGHVVAGNYGSGYLRRLVSVGAFENGRLEVTTESAYITDVIRDGAFRVQTHPAASAWIEGDGIIGGRQSYLETTFALFSPSTDWGLTCGGAVPADIRPIFDIDLDLEMMMDVREGEGFFDPPFLYNALFAITGSVEIGVEVKSDVELSASCSLDIIALLRDRLGNQNLFKMELPEIRFAAGPLPVVITHAIEPTFGVEGALQADISPFEVRATVTFGARAGIEKINGGDWRGIWQPSRVGNATLTVPNSIASVSASVQAAAGVQYSAFAWDLVGPSFALQDSITGSVSVDPNTCEWETTVTASSDFVAGINLQIPIIDYSLASVSKTFNLASAQISRETGVWDSLCEVDAGVVDAGVGDAGAIDAGFVDAGTIDGPVDAGSPDALISGPNTIYFAAGNPGTGSVNKAALDGTGASVIIPATEDPQGMAIDPIGKKVYWTGGPGIQQANLDGSAVQTVITGTIIVSVTVDAVNGKLYWADSGPDKIRRSNLDGSGVQDVVTTGVAPFDVAVDPVGGKLYWSESNPVGIKRANLDGSSVETLVTMNLSPSASIAVDPMGGKIYWTYRDGPSVHSANLDGTGVALVATVAPAPRSIAVDGTGGRLYWSNNGTHTITSANLDGSGLAVILTGVTKASGVEVGPAN